ncbi:MAG: barstar family protein [Boseongicola sp.]
MNGKADVVEIDGSAISTWQEFHDVFAKQLGFPDFYGRNMNAWIDCMTSLDCPEDGLTNIHAPSGGVLTLLISNAKKLRNEAGEIWEALNECAAFVNWRKIEVGERAVLSLAYYK